MLDQTKITELWKAPRNKTAIERAAYDNERQMFHAQLSMDKNDTNPYFYHTFLPKAQRILNNTEKFNKFSNLIPFPLVSNNLISKGTDEWNKVFSAQDRVEEFRFTDEAYQDDFMVFLDKIDFKSTIQQNLFTKVKQAVNTIAIVDVPAAVEGQLIEGERLAEPFIYFVETGKCKDVDVDHSGNIQYVMFETGSKEKDNRRLIVIDTEYYRSFRINKDRDELSKEVESPHGLGFCPATFVWRDVVDPDLPIRRYNSVLESVADMDRYIMADVFKDHADLYASFPILWRYIDPVEPNYDDLDSNGNPRKVEVPYMGPGWEIALEVPLGESSKMSTPAGFINAEATLLNYNKDKVRTLEVKIIKHLTGVDNEIQNEKAFNESQIRSQYETRHAVLGYWAENLQYVHNFLVTTIAKIRYGDSFVSANINYGNDFFIYDTITATKEYGEAKEAGLPAFMIAERRKVVKMAATRNSPNMQARYDVLEQLEPYLDIALKDIDKLTPEYELKANFQSYIDRFEREQGGNIVTFAMHIDFGEKIKLIKSKLYDYVKENREFSQKNSIKQPDDGKPGQGEKTPVS